MYLFLRRFRLFWAALFLVAITLVFTDVSGNVAGAFQGILRWQFVPAALGVATGGLGVLLCLLLLTLLFGRVYCSFLCPAGIFQDVVSTVANRFKIKKARRYRYAPPHRWLRYSLLTLTVAFLLLGNMVLVQWLDPYGLYGRMAENLFRPAVIGLNNAGASWFSATFYHISYKTFTVGSVVAGALFFVTLTVMSAVRGRLYCNTICPVGTLLGIVSKYSIFRLDVQKSACTHCRLCELACKAQCIDARQERLDASRCVQCYRCTTVCRTHAIEFRLRYAKKVASGTPADPRRRRVFLASAGTLAAAAVLRTVAPRLSFAANNTKAIAPPGARGIDHLKRHCTACHACIARCPREVIRPALGEYGADGFLLPVMDYDNAYCNYRCTECSHVCPNDALQPLTEREKITTQIGKAHFLAENCIVTLDGTDCGACDEHCPTKAVHMVDFRDGLLIPEVDASLCIGCGGCEYICPGRPGKAIFVVANAEHQTVRLPQTEKQKEINVDDFGF